ncbi:hypothetical protein KIN20_004719 [Parelaphostrongylus tenuis]|uniref:Uncharacterized protein n=1 Tax=Parelaphostrongylus tenuis TaxID=148309 RepID=A0AAD5QEN1_PARTN|nr:hypothetical protein KIN20_004719 [Parelaphostrongylus tenuis]
MFDGPVVFFFGVVNNGIFPESTDDLNTSQFMAVLRSRAELRNSNDIGQAKPLIY